MSVSAPEIAVEQPAGTNIPDAGSKGFGSVVVGSSSLLVFTIRNTGNADLTGLAVSKDGANAGDFTLSSNPSAPVAGLSGSSTFTVTFSPTAVGTRTAAIHIANNDSDEAPFDINLSGTGLATPEPPVIVIHPASVGIVSGERATLETAGAKKRSAKGQCELTPGAAVAGVSAVFPAASGVPAEAVTFSVDGGSPHFSGTFDGGVVRGFRLAKGTVVPASATPCTMVLDAGSQDGINVPAGFGWLKGTMGVKGAGVFAGMLGDATPVSVSLRLSPAGQAVVWAQPYPDKRSFIGGIVTLEGLGLPASGEKLADGLWWHKAADPKSQSYPNGFPAMRISLGTSKWVVPSTAVELGASQGWRDNRLTSVTTEGAGFDNQDPLTPLALPQELTLDDSFNLRASAVTMAARDGDDDDGDDDHDDRDDDDGWDDTLKNLWSGRVSRFDGAFSGNDRPAIHGPANHPEPHDAGFSVSC